MSTPLDKTELTRLAWITELRRQGDRQCEGDYARGALVCALGLLLEVSGSDPTNRDTFPTGWRGPADIGNLAGLDPLQANDIAARNDGATGFHCETAYHKHTFAEIADVVEGWFK